MLVAIGSALFTMVGAYGFHDFLAAARRRTDPTRIAAQVVTGIGFLGAGLIFRAGFSVRGLTTAASLWLVAAIGMACRRRLLEGRGGRDRGCADHASRPLASALKERRRLDSRDAER